MMKIQTKMAITIAVIIISILLSTGTFSYFFGKNVILDLSLNRLSAIASLQANRFNNIIDGHLIQLRMISNQTILLNQLQAYNQAENPETHKQLSKILFDFKTTSEFIENVFILKDGAVFAKSNPSSHSNNLPINELSIPANHENKNGIYILNDPEQGIRIFFLKNLKLNKSILGSLVLETGNQEFYDFFSANQLVGETGESYILRALPDGNKQFLPPFKIYIPDTSTFSSHYGLTRTSQEGFQEISDYDGHEVFIVSYPILNNELQYAVKIQTSEVLSPVNRWRSLALAIFILVLITSVLISIILASRLSKSLKLLTERVKEFRKGGSIPLEKINKADWEVSQLESAFIDMAETRISIEKLAKENERYISLMLNSLGEGVIATDINGLITKINPVASDLTGWSPEKALGEPLQNVFSLFNSESQRAIETPVNAIIARNETTFSGDNILLISRDGQERHVSGSASPIKEGDIAHGIIIVFQDITEEYTLRAEQEESRQFFKNVLDDMQTFAGVLEPDGTLIFANNTPLLLAGITDDEVIGKPLWETIWFSHSEEVRKQVKSDVEAAANGKPILHDMQVIMGSSILWVQFSIHPFFDKEGKVKYLVPEGQNIQHRIEIEKQLLKSQERLRLHQELSEVGFIEWDKDFKVTEWNPAAENIFGYSHKEVQGKKSVDIIVPDITKVTVENLWQGFKVDKESTHRIFENITKNGKTIICEWFNTALTDDEGEFIGIASLVRDITEQRKQEEQLRQSQKLEALGQLTGGIAHDFNNMLNIILGYNELVKDQVNGNAKLTNYVEQIEVAGTRCADLTRKLLGFSKTHPESPSLCNLNQIIHESKNMLEKSLTARIKVQYNLQEGLWPNLINPGEFRDSLINLSINAMHAMAESGTLTISTNNTYLDKTEATRLNLDKGDYTKFSISDTGCGIEEDLLEHIFDPFFSTKGELGTGLGLSQVYGFVKRAKGNIHVYSELGLGSRFDLYFPRVVSGEKLIIKNVEDKPEETLQGNETILIVDDEAALRELTAKILKKQGYTILIAGTGEEALNTIDSNSVSLLITDVIMPKMNGHDLIDNIKRKHPNIKTLLVSGFDKKKQMGDSSESILLKPFSSQDLLRQVRSILDR